MLTLSEIGNIPVDFAVLKSMYPDYKSVHNKISELENSGTLIRLKKGMYIVSPEDSSELLSIEEVFIYLEEKLCFDMDTLFQMDINIFEQCA